MGYLVTLLALARFFAPDPNATPTEVTPAAVESDASEADGLLRPIVFLPGALPLTAAPRDLRNPFDQAQRKAKASMVKTSDRRAQSADLRDPFADTPRKHRSLDAAPDLRDPFEPARPRTLPRCPDTDGVPIQRPEGAAPGCKQASRRRTVLAHR